MEKLVKIVKQKIGTVPFEDNVLFGDEAVRLKEWMNDGRRDAGMMYGVCGSGMTTLVDSIVDESSVEPLFIDASTPSVAKVLYDCTITNTSSSGLNKVIVVDGINTSTTDKNTLSAISTFVKTGKTKLLCIGHRSENMKSKEFTAKWVNFNFFPPSPDAMSKVLERGGLTKDVSDHIVRINAPGDLRSCLNAMRMERVKPGASHCKDTFEYGVDAVASMLVKSESTIDRILEEYYQEPMLISSGIHENYINTLGKKDMEIAARMSESFSAADTVMERIGSSQDYAHMYLHGALTSVATKLTTTNTKRPEIKKFGSIWSKENAGKTNAKKIRSFCTKMKSVTGSDLSTVDLDHVRMIFKSNMNFDDKKKTYEYFKSIGAEDVLFLFRTGFQPYKHDKLNALFKAETS